MADVVMVGAGPVGLWTALQIKKRCPDWSVVLYERHAVYQRSHVLRLDHWSLLLYGRQQATNPHEQAFYQAITHKTIKGIVRAAAGSVYIRTNDLEAALKTYALAMGIELRSGTVTDPAALMATHPECARFIAADGAHSKMRTALLGEAGVDEYPLQRIVEAKYQVRGPVARLKNWRTNARLHHMAFEYVGKPKDGFTPITVRFFLDEATYAALPPASFKEPLTLDDPRLPPRLAQDLGVYLGAREKASGEQVCMDTARLTSLTLSLYAARHFTQKIQERAWFLVGDAAMGVPYFRALNSGLILGSRLAQILTARTWPFHQNLTRQVALYEFHRPLHIASEFSIARGKDMALQTYNAVRKGPWADWGTSLEDSVGSTFDLSQSGSCTQAE